MDYLFLRASFYFLGVNHIKQELPINEQIRFKEVQVIDEQGQKVGKLPINQALDMAASKDLDLVLVSGNSDNPVCKIMNYGKHKFEQAKREKESRKKQKTVECKELRVTPNIRKFLSDGNKVRITVRFRGREVNYVKSGEDVLNKFIEELSDISTVEKKPFLEGKNMFIILAPSK